jgi:hypothetical protein
MGIIQKYLFQHITLTRHFNTRSNMFNTAARAWNYGRWAHNTYTCFMVAIQSFIWVILATNDIVYRLLPR